MRTFTRVMAWTNIIIAIIGIVAAGIIILITGVISIGMLHDNEPGFLGLLVIPIVVLIGGLVAGYIMTWRALLGERVWAWWVLTVLLGLDIASSVIGWFEPSFPVQCDDPPDILGSLILFLSFIALITDPPGRWVPDRVRKRRRMLSARTPDA